MNRTQFWLISILHLVVALYYKWNVGFSIIAGPDIDWNYFWQTLPLDALRTNVFESLWYFHAQPPLYNAYGALLIGQFYPNHLEVMHYVNIILGSLLSGMMVPILIRFTDNQRFSFIIAAVLALNPTLFLYEAYILYTLPVAFLIVASTFCLANASPKLNTGYLYAFIFVLNLLILTRSLYHVGILLMAIPLACIMAGRQWWRVLAISIIISLMSVGWYYKNFVEFDFFGASSWRGLSIWRIVSFGYSDIDQFELADQGIIDPVVAQHNAFTPPSVYIEAGFNVESTVDVLNQDDFNNINIIAISQLYEDSARRLIDHNQNHYINNVISAYLAFTKPSSQFIHPSFPTNAPNMGLHEALSSQYIQGQIFAERYTGLKFGPFVALLLPLTLMLYVLHIVRQCGVSPSRWFLYIQSNAPMIFAAFLIFYTVLVSSLFEFGENERFKVLVEQLMWAFFVGVAYQYSPLWNKTMT